MTIDKNLRTWRDQGATEIEERTGEYVKIAYKGKSDLDAVTYYAPYIPSIWDIATKTEQERRWREAVRSLPQARKQVRSGVREHPSSDGQEESNS